MESLPLLDELFKESFGVDAAFAVVSGHVARVIVNRVDLLVENTDDLLLAEFLNHCYVLSCLH
jgi:hypothetical protein